LVGVAVNVTELPAQNGFDGVEIVTLTGRFGLTAIGYWMLDAGLFVVQVSDELRITETRSPFAGI
jgi:hypothetical protein